MAISTYSQYLSLISQAHKWHWCGIYTSMTNARWYIPSVANTASSTPIAPGRTSSFNLFNQEFPSVSNALYAAEMEVEHAGNYTMGILCDLLWIQAGFSSTITTTQTVNSPAVALSRYTSGEGVMAVIQTQSSATGTPGNITISYTNQAGVSGRTSQPHPLVAGATNTGDFLVLQDGDTGIRSIESVTLDAAATAGSFALYLIKPLFMLPAFTMLGPAYKNGLIGGAGSLIKIENDACLIVLEMTSSAGIVDIASFALTTILVS